MITHTVTECKSMCLIHSEAKQYQNFRVWGTKRCTAGPGKEIRVAQALKKKSQISENFQQGPFIGKVWRGVVSCCKLLGVRFFVLGGQIPMFLEASTKQMLFSDLTRKGMVPKFNSHPSRSRPGLKRRGSCEGQLPCPGGFVQHPVCILPSVLRHQVR